MEISLPEIIDRITILKLKIENGGADFKEELEEYQKALKEFEDRGVKINPEWINELYERNKYQWGLESSLRKLKEKKEDLKEMGKLYIELQISNKKRVAIKNRIAENSGSGFKDIKIN